jgi:hypothetical protein
MDRFEALMLGIVSIIALLLLLISGFRTITGGVVENFEAFDFGLQQLPYSPLPAIEIVQPSEAIVPGIPQEYLAPSFITLQVDQVTIPEVSTYHFISLKKNSLHTYAGTAGEYDFDPTAWVKGYLCTYAYKVQNSPLYCERVPLRYTAGTLTFARGYAPDEYIASHAVGKDFAAVFVLQGPIATLATSPVAYLRWTS